MSTDIFSEQKTLNKEGCQPGSLLY